mmetsp:Transcript_48761/g.88115  ORF Transcript_48761/g.88115 Transcript_48761/m.88115 type:complete len:206 (-) Transcript_48761:184-801(-)
MPSVPGTIIPPISALCVTLAPISISTTSTFRSSFQISALLDEEVRHVDLATFDALAHRTSVFVPASAYAVLGLQVAKHLVWIAEVVLLEPEPQRILIWFPDLIGGCYYSAHTISRELVVRQVNLLNRTAFPEKFGQLSCTIVIKVVPVELQHAEVFTFRAKFQYPLQPLCGERILGEVHLLVGVRRIFQREVLQVSVSELALRVV